MKLGEISLYNDEMDYPIEIVNELDNDGKTAALADSLARTSVGIAIGALALM